MGRYIKIKAYFEAHFSEHKPMLKKQKHLHYSLSSASDKYFQTFLSAFGIQNIIQIVLVKKIGILS